MSRTDEVAGSPCIDDAQYAAILEGLADKALLAKADEHAAACDPCRVMLACAGRVRAQERRATGLEETLVVADRVTGNDALAEEDEADAIGVGSTIGRYILLEEIGRGGMGIVYAARDDTLQRDVAVKVLGSKTAREGGHKRLLREARAMANVDHPNVVTVYDSGEHDGHVYIVMDLVRGGDLGQWHRADPRSWREVVTTWISAGRGLAAVHAAGLVHRDFKPANVLVHRDGRVQVTDFGLVGVTAEQSHSDSSGRAELLAEDRTVTGTVLGTPRYMSPEQLTGGIVGPATDQFAYCVSLYEALAGVHPFGKGDALDRVSQMSRGVVALPTGGAEAPARVLATVRRGLAIDPAERFATIDALLLELRRSADAGRRRAQVGLALFGVTGVLAAGIVIGDYSESQLCDAPAGGDFTGVWDAKARAALRSGIDDTAGPGSEWARVETIVDAYVTQWSAARRSACEATRVRAEVSEDMLDRRMACLSQRRAAVGALVEVVAARSPSAQPDALGLAYELPALDDCSDLAALATVAARPGGDARLRIEHLEREYILARTQFRSGRVSDAAQRLDAALAEATVLDYAPLTAALLTQRALVLSGSDPAAALAKWREAYVAATTAGSLVSFETGVDGVGILVAAGNTDEAGFILDLARAHAEQLGGEPRPGELATNSMIVAVARGDGDAVLAFARAAVEARERSAQGGEALADAYGNLGAALAGNGQPEAAQPFIRQAEKLTIDAYGPEHPQSLRFRSNYAMSLLGLSQFEEAREVAESIARAQRDSEIPLDLAMTQNVLGKVATAQGRTLEALQYHAASLELRRRALPPGHRLVLHALVDVGRAEVSVGRSEAAIATLDEAVRLADPNDTSVAPLIVQLHALLSIALRDRGDLGRSLVEATRAHELAEALQGDPGLEGRQAYAHALGASGRSREATEILERAIELAEQSRAWPRDRAELHVDQADLFTALAEPGRAREHATLALAIVTEARDLDNAVSRRAQAHLEGGTPTAND